MKVPGVLTARQELVQFAKYDVQRPFDRDLRLTSWKNCEFPEIDGYLAGDWNMCYFHLFSVLFGHNHPNTLILSSWVETTKQILKDIGYNGTPFALKHNSMIKSIEREISPPALV